MKIEITFMSFSNDETWQISENFLDKSQKEKRKIKLPIHKRKTKCHNYENRETNNNKVKSSRNKRIRGEFKLKI